MVQGAPWVGQVEPMKKKLKCDFYLMWEIKFKLFNARMLFAIQKIFQFNSDLTGG